MSWRDTVREFSLPALALISLRAFPPHGAIIVVGLFIIVWATDTGALICGMLVTWYVVAGTATQAAF